jgi:serine protease
MVKLIHMKKGISLFSIIILLILIPFQVASEGRHAKINLSRIPSNDYQPGEVIVKFKEAVPVLDHVSLLSHLPYKKLKTLNSHTFHLTVETGNLTDLLAELNQEEAVAYAEPNFIARAFFVPNDPYYSYQWNFKKIGLEKAWDLSKGKDVIVAIIDSGVAYENYWFYKQAPDLAGTSFVPGYDFVEGDSHPNDTNGHGTHIAGTIAQMTDNNLGVAGIAHQAKIMPVKVLDQNGAGTYAAVAQGISWAVDHGAQIINLSLGGSYPSQFLEEAVRYAAERGVLVIAAAGNEGTSGIAYPAAYDNEVLAIGAVRFDKQRSYYSNYGTSLDLVAPGGDLNVDQNGDGYGDGILQQTVDTYSRRFFGQNFSYYFYQGTSMATAHVSGVAALIMASGITSADLTKTTLIQTAEDLGDPGRDDYYGYGLVNALAAVQNLGSETLVNLPPVAKITGDEQGKVDQNLSFDGLQSYDQDGEIIKWQWNFADTNQAEGAEVNHTFKLAGSYTVTLTVTDNQGAKDTTHLVVAITEEPASPDELQVKVIFKDSGGEEKTTFATGERVYIVIYVYLNNEPLKKANFEAKLYDPDNYLVAQKNRSTNSSGYYQFSERVKKTGRYVMQTRVSYGNLPQVVRQDSFEVGNK